jgi:iron-sulfur cluster repair protein YtfE (RIC family)
MNSHAQLSSTMAKDPLKLDEFMTRKQNLMNRGRNELRSIAVSPKIIQQHVFNTFHDRLKSYQHHDITLSTKHHGVRAVSQMIQEQLQNKPVDRFEPMFNVGKEDLVAFKRRKQFQEVYVKSQLIKEMKDEVYKQVLNEVRAAGGVVPEDNLY